MVVRISVDSAQQRRMRVRLQQPRRAIRIIAQQLLIFFRAKVARPDNARAIDIGRVVNPLLKLMLRPVANENQLLAGLRVRAAGGSRCGLRDRRD